MPADRPFHVVEEVNALVIAVIQNGEDDRPARCQAR